jgi:rRNA-processing protein FCF1
MNMTATVKLGLPVMRFKIHVRYSTPRVPNALEAALIQIVRRFSVASAYREWRIETVFEELLCVPEPRLPLTAVLNELVDIRVLATTTPFNDTRDIRIGDLSLTARGHAMLSTGKMLGRPQESAVLWAWDPLAQQACNERQWQQLDANQPDLAVAADPFMDMFPEQAFRAFLETGDRIEWYRRGDTVIEGIEVPGETELCWSSALIKLALQQGRIVLDSARGDAIRYLEQLSDMTPLIRLASAAFGSNGPAYATWEIEAPGVQEDLVALSHFDAVATGVIPVYIDERAAQALPALAQCPAQALRIIYTDDEQRMAGQEINVNWYEDDGCTIKLAQAFPVAGCHLAHGQHVWRLGRARLRIGQADVIVPVARRRPGDMAQATQDLVAQLVHTRQDNAIAAALTLSPQVAWHALLQMLREEHSGRAYLDEVNDWADELRRLPVGKTAGARLDDKSLCDAFAHALATHSGPLNDCEFADWCAGLARLSLNDASPSLTVLIDKIAPLETIAQLGIVTSQARTVLKNHELTFSPETYGLGLVMEILALASEREVLAVLLNKNAFEVAVRQIWRQGGLVAKTLGRQFPPGAASSADIRKIVRTGALKRCLSEIAHWQGQLAALHALAGVSNAAPDSVLERCSEQLRRWEESLRKAALTDDSAFDFIFVVDTNALIKLPELPLRIGLQSLLVLPATVIEELDRKKMDPLLSVACATATRHLLAMPAASIRYEHSDLSLLPEDYRASADNRILSVVLKFDSEKVRLVTNDKNLTLKANALKQIAVPVDRFVIADKPRESALSPIPAKAKKLKKG